MGLVDEITAVSGKYRAQISDVGQLFPNVQNFGLKAGQRAFRHKAGSYHQFAVRAEVDIPPLITNLRVAEAVRALEANDEAEAARWLTLEHEYAASGAGVVYAALCLWLDKTKIEVPREYRTKAGVLDKALQSRLLLTRGDVMPYRLSIAGIGCVDGGETSVVPEEWLGKSFDSGEALCRAIDTQPHRESLPDARYCCHYGLKLFPEPRWLENVEVCVSTVPAYVVSVIVENNRLKTSIQRLSSDSAQRWMDSLAGRARFLRHEFAPPGNEDAGFGRVMMIACDQKGVCEDMPSYEKNGTVGTLSSLMQKCIRRGRGTVAMLKSCLERLRRCPTYNLPDNQFKRSSGSRQMAWRLFISIFEDASPYAPSPEGDYLSMEDLVALSILAHAEPEIQFNQFITDKIIRTALLVQHNDLAGQNWDWRAGGKRAEIHENSDFEKTCAAALEFLPMMKRDAEMLRQGCDHLRIKKLQFEQLDSSLTNEELLSAADPDLEQQTKLTAFDFHCCPSLLLFLQASLPSSSLAPARLEWRTTQSLRRFIWENVSRMNSRNPQHVPANDAFSQAVICEIQAIQQWLSGGGTEVASRESYAGSRLTRKNDEPITPAVSRTAFISLFGQAVELSAASSGQQRKLKHAFVGIVAGTPLQPCKIKKHSSGKSVYFDGVDRASGTLDLVAHLKASDGLEVDVPPPPTGYRWIFKEGTKTVRIRIEASPTEIDRPDESCIPLIFQVDQTLVPAFDARCLLEKREEAIPVIPSNADESLIKSALYLEDVGQGSQWRINQMLRVLARHRQDRGEPDLLWHELALQSPLPAVVWQRIATKLLGTFLGRVTIGPVDRRGNALYSAVDYHHEGTLWRVFNLLAFVFPECVQPCGDLDFKINKESSSYTQLLQDIAALASPRVDSHPVIEAVEPRITSTLWHHQTSSVERICEELLKKGRKGFGDASDVGSGKTLTSLAIMCKIAAHNRDANDISAEAFLVLVYNESLVDTWRSEIQKHSEGFHWVTQDKSGRLSAPIGPNSILVTTLGRMRDTPVTRRWHLVVIDECLSVQNANALWTQEAWKQVACSQRGVLLLSATFFRTRFNELFYLLRMLRTGLPKCREYLDAILSESIICHLPQATPWKWLEETRLLRLEDATRQAYERIKRSNETAKTIYGRLDSLLVHGFDFSRHVHALLDEMDGDARALIFARSEEEARWIESLKPDIISLFPDTQKKHVVTTTAKAARGVNTLTGFNILMTRPVSPDLVPQMRGRLARPGQQHTELRWVWLVIENTIEQAKLENNRLAEKFQNDHIMPLANFYERALQF